MKIIFNEIFYKNNELLFYISSVFTILIIVLLIITGIKVIRKK